MKIMKKYVVWLLIITLLTNMFYTNVTIQARNNRQSNNNEISKSKDEQQFEELVDKEKVQLIIKYKDDVNNQEDKQKELKEKLKDKKFKEPEITKSFQKQKIDVMEIDENDDLDDIMEELRKDKDIEIVQPNYSLYSLEDEFLSEQWAIENSDNESVDLNVIPVWDKYGYGESVLIGILDTEIEIDHDDLVDSIYINEEEIPDNGIDDDDNGYIDDVNGWDFYNGDETLYDSVGDEHGTHIAGVVSAQANNIGVRGMIPEGVIVPLKFMEDSQGYTSDVLEAIEYAQELGITIINCSFGSSEYNDILYDTMNDSDILFVCASGNSGNEDPIYPAAYNLANVISVGAINEEGNTSDFSNYGEYVDVYAPGEGIISTLPGNSYGYKSGTSIATGYVTALASLVQSYGDIDHEVENVTTAAAIALTITDSVVDSSEEILNAYEVITNSLLIDNAISDESSSDSTETTTGSAISVDISIDETIIDGEENQGLVDVTTSSAITFDLSLIDDITTFSDTSEELLDEICQYYNLDKTLVLEIESRGYDTEETLYLSYLASNYSFSIEEIEILITIYGDFETIENEISIFDELVAYDFMTDYLTDEVKDYIFEGYGMEDIGSAVYVAHMLGVDLVDCIREDVEERYETNYSGEESITNEDFLSLYFVDSEWLSQYLLENNVDITEIYESISEFISVVIVDDIVLTALSEENVDSYITENSPFKFGATNTNNVNLNSGTLVYENIDLSLPGKNGLDLNLITRYSSNNANAWKQGLTVDYDDGDKDYENKLNSTTYNEEVNNLGMGWSFAITSIDVNSYYYDAQYVYFADGGVHGVVSDFNSDGKDNLENYDFDDLIFKEEHEEVGDQTSKFTIEYKDGKKEYFSYKGRLIGVQDRFGNTICFEHEKIEDIDKTLLTKITDTYNREITIDYTSDSITLNTPDQNKIVYELDGSKLAKRIDQDNRETLFEYDITSHEFTFKSTANELSNSYYDLTTITYPTGAQSIYTYETGLRKLGSTGYEEYSRVLNQKEVDGDNTYNYLEYTYPNPLSTYRLLGDNNIDDYTYGTVVTDSENNITSYTFNNEHQRTNIVYELADDSVKSETNYYYDDEDEDDTNDYDNKLPKIIENTTYGDNENIFIINVENYEYDSCGDITSYWDAQANRDSEYQPSDDEHKISYIYDDTYHILTETQLKQNESTYISQDYSLTSDNKSVEYAYVYCSGELEAKTQYVYNDDGTINEERHYIEEYDWVEYLSIYYTYDYSNSENSSFGIENLGVEDVDGNSIGSRTTTSTYDVMGNLVAVTDPNENSTTYEYDNLGRVTTITNTDGSVVNYTYDDANNALVVEDATSEVSYDYDGLGNLESITDLIDNEVLIDYTYDNKLRLETETIYNNTVSTSIGDSIVGEEHTITYDYTLDGRTESKVITDSSGNTLYEETYSYEDAYDGIYNKVTKTVEGNGETDDIVTTSYTDVVGNVVKQGRLLDGDEYYDTAEYDYVGNKLEEKSARAYDENWGNDYNNKFEYDYAGRVTTAYDINDLTTISTYDVLGRLTSITDPKGNTAYIEYDDLGRKIHEKSPLEEDDEGTIYYMTTKYYYDNNSNLISQKSLTNEPGETENWNETDYEYDDMNRLVKVITYDNGQVENYTQYYYDEVGNKLRMYTGLSEALTINGLDDVTTNGDTEYSVTKYSYDQYGNLISLIDPLSQTQSFTYDLKGNLVESTDRNGAVTINQYDGLNRVVEMMVYDADSVEEKKYTYSYDAIGNKAYEIGEGKTISYTYNGWGQLETETDSDGFTKSYTYDIGGNKKSFSLKENDETSINTTYDYDEYNRLEYVYEDGVLEATYTYDNNGNRASLIYTNGNEEIYTYNKSNQISALINKEDDETLSSYEYSYYLDGNKASEVESILGDNRYYTYDGLERLTCEKIVDSTDTVTSQVTYTFDDYNNRATKSDSISGEVVTYIYDLNNRLDTEVSVTGEDDTNETTKTTTYTYDANGNQLVANTETLSPVNASETESYDVYVLGTQEESDVTVYEYNSLNQLVTSYVDDMTVDYTYNIDGLRESKTVNGETTTHIWNGANIVLEQDGVGNTTSTYIRGINLIYAEDEVSEKTYYLYNAHGDVVHLTDESGAVSKSYQYDAYGNELNEDEVDGNPFRYCGEYYDKETGTIYLRARYYNPAIGRFISEDTYLGNINDPMSLNLYTYCHNNPVMFIDPSGYTPRYMKIEDYYYFIPTNKTFELGLVGIGFVPFGGLFTWGVEKLFNANEDFAKLEVNELEDVYSAASATFLDGVSNLSEYSDEWLGKTAGIVGVGLTGWSIREEWLSTDYQLEHVINNLVGCYLTSDSKEGLIARYVYAKQIIEFLIDEDRLSYEFEDGELVSIEKNDEDIENLKRELFLLLEDENEDEE